MASKHSTPLSPLPYPNKRFHSFTSSASSIPSLSYTPTPSAASSVASTPLEERPDVAYAIRKRSLLHPQKEAQLNQQPNVETIGMFKCLEEANNTVYRLRLDYETCDPCFFWYGDGHGSSHPEFASPGSSSASTASSAAETAIKGDCLSWEVFPDEDEVSAVGCRVWVERVEVNVWGGVEVGVDRGDAEDGKAKIHNWREALEPIARPCEFWGSFKLK